MVWVKWKPVRFYTLEGKGARLTDLELPFQGHAGIVDQDVVTELPIGVSEADLWLDLAIGRQTLVLYRGKTHSTPRGTFRVRSKHLTSRMRADEKPPQRDGDKSDARYRIDDVPFVQFFHAGYALHAAYWHDGFGQPKSHGCVNLSPRDALYLFGKTSPAVPDGWHGVVARQYEGTLLHVRVF